MPPPPPPRASRALEIVVQPESDHDEGLQAPASRAVAARQSGEMEGLLASSEITQRLDTWQLKRSSSGKRVVLAAAALFTIGAVVPLGYQLLQTHYGTSRSAAAILSYQQPSTRFAMASAHAADEQRRAAEKLSGAVAPIAPVPTATHGSDVQQSLAKLDEDLPLGVETPSELGPPAPDTLAAPELAREALETQRKAPAKAVSPPRAARNPRAAAATPSSIAPAAAALEEDASSSKAAKAPESERNPYLR
jgi:hypothetical protein